ncbi:hypothetical protein HHI36_013377, partial [Cryptolaemus montrouzieri]
MEHKRIKRHEEYVRRDAESKKAYDIFKKIYNLKINEKIKENNENQIRKASNKSRAMWKIIKPAKGKSEEEKSNLTAGEMNEYLAGVGQSTAEEVNQTSVSYADYFEDLKLDTKLSGFLFDCTGTEIRKLFASLKGKNTVDSYYVSSSHLKLLSKELAEPLSILINKSFKDGYFPGELKKSK